MSAYRFHLIYHEWNGTWLDVTEYLESRNDANRIALKFSADLTEADVTISEADALIELKEDKNKGWLLFEERKVDGVKQWNIDIAPSILSTLK